MRHIFVFGSNLAGRHGEKCAAGLPGDHVAAAFIIAHASVIASAIAHATADANAGAAASAHAYAHAHAYVVTT